MRTFLAIFTALFFSILGSSAAPQESGHTLQFKIYTWYGGSNQSNTKLSNLYFSRGGKMIPLKLNQAEVSKQHKTTVKNSFTLFQKQMNDDGEAAYQPVVSTPIPKSLKHAFIYFFPSKEKNTLLAIDTSLRAFPKGSVLFLNESEKNIGVKINNRVRPVKTKKRANILYSPTPKGTLRIQVKDYTDHKQKKHTNLSVMTVGARQGQRVIAFFYQLKGGQHRLLLERGVDDQSIKITPKP